MLKYGLSHLKCHWLLLSVSFLWGKTGTTWVADPQHQKAFSFDTSFAGHKESNALAKSRYMMSDSNPRSRALPILWNTSKSCRSTTWLPFLKPVLIGVQDLLDMGDQTGDQTPLLNFRKNGKQRYGAISFNQIFFALFLNGWDIFAFFHSVSWRPVLEPKFTIAVTEGARDSARSFNTIKWIKLCTSKEERIFDISSAETWS